MSDEKRLDRIERLVESNAIAIANLKVRVTDVTASVEKLEGSVRRLEISVGRLEQKIDSTNERNNERLDQRFAKLEKALSWKIIAGYVAGGTLAGLFTMTILLLQPGF